MKTIIAKFYNNLEEAKKARKKNQVILQIGDTFLLVSKKQAEKL